MPVPAPSIVGLVSGIPGERFTDADVAVAWDVPRSLVVDWIERGLLRASLTRHGFRIRLRALRRAVLDHPEVAEAVLRPKAKKERR